jgi:hypothetical protein
MRFPGIPRPRPRPLILCVHRRRPRCSSGRCRRLAAVHGPLTAHSPAGDGPAIPPTAAVRLRTAGVPPRCGKVKRPASSTVNLPVSRPLSCCRASTPCSARRPRGVQTRSFDVPHGPLAAVSRYEGLQYPAAAEWHTRGLMFASRPRSPPTAPTSHRPEHWLEALTHTVVTWGPLGRTRLTGREPTHALRARTPLLGAQRARRVPLRASCQSSSCPEKDRAQPQPR